MKSKEIALNLLVMKLNENKNFQSLSINQGSIEFIFSLIIWYRILEKVNIVSKLFQSPSIDTGIATKHLQALIQFFEEFRDEGFDSSLAESRELARRLDINPEFKDNRIRSG